MKIKNYKGILIILVSLFLVLTPANAKDKSDEQNYSEVQYNLEVAYEQGERVRKHALSQTFKIVSMNAGLTYQEITNLEDELGYKLDPDTKIKLSRTAGKLLSTYQILLIVILFYFILFIPLRKIYIKIRNNNNIKIFKSIILMLIPTVLLLVLFVICFALLHKLGMHISKYILNLYIINVL
ncbi:MAG: hypothetical protein P8N25_00215 [Alphaproteobacteria bacterium]|nr:hypothetical protein [Alphaproteobacteria bacterium]